MTAQETNLLNAFETTLTGTIGASDLTMTVNSVVDSASNTLTAPCYLVVNPDSATNREVLLVSSINVGTKTLTISAIGNRYLTGSAATSGLSHASGSVVRMSPLQQHIEDINDRVDTIINSDGTAVVTTGVVKDEDNMASDSATHLATQQSIKAYVDSQVTAQDLDFGGDSGTGAVDLDSQTFTIAGTANEVETSATGQTLTIGLPSSITVNVTGNVTGDLTGNVTATSVLADGVTATTQSASDNSTKVATTAYVDAQVTAEDLDFGGDTGTGSVDLDSQTFTIAGTTNEIETSATGQTLTIGLPSSITVNVTGDLTGNASTATALETARTIGGVSFDGTANISLPGVDTAGTQNTSGTAAGLSATLVVGSGGTGQTSYTDGQLLIGNSTGNTLDKATLTQGSNVTITNGGGSITIAATDTNTEYTAGDGLDLTGTVFSTDLKTNGGLSIDTTELKLDLNDLSAASVSVANDSIAIIDADDNSSKKESIADLATAMADGSTITASNGVLTAAGGGGVSLGLVLALG